MKTCCPSLMGKINSFMNVRLDDTFSLFGKQKGLCFNWAQTVTFQHTSHPHHTVGNKSDAPFSCCFLWEQTGDERTQRPQPKAAHRHFNGKEKGKTWTTATLTWWTHPESALRPTVHQHNMHPPSHGAPIPDSPVSPDWFQCVQASVRAPAIQDLHCRSAGSSPVHSWLLSFAGGPAVNL